MTHPAPTVDSFIQRWAASGAAERANYQLFLSELCTLLDVPPPDPTRPDDADNAYVFERNVHFLENDGSTTIGRIDLYKRGAFVLEAKQGSDAATADDEAAAALQAEKTKKPKRRGTAVRGTKSWDDAMVRARGQADRYARALPVSEGWPPFLVVVDVGHSIELYSEFSRSGKTYVPFPDPKSFRILLADLRRDEIRARLRQVWLDPLALDPSRRAAKVTRELAERLAELAKLLEKAGHHPEDVARFLMRCLFTMFAEDVELIPRGSFKDLLGGLLDEPENFKPAAEDLWRTMNTGGFSPILRKRLLRFNGGLFAESDALPLTRPMLELLHEAAGADWTDVEPAIFGTLLERALEPGRAAQAGRPLHAAGLRRTAGPADGHRALAGGLAGGLRRGGHRGPAGRPGRRAGNGPRLPRAALQNPRARPGLRLRQFPLRHAGTDEAAGRRSARTPSASSATRSRRCSRSIRTSSWGSRSTRGPRPSPSWCCGSATCNGTSAPAATPRPPSRSSRTTATSNAATPCWPGTARKSSSTRT